MRRIELTNTFLWSTRPWLAKNLRAGLWLYDVNGRDWRIIKVLAPAFDRDTTRLMVAPAWR